MPCDIRGVLQSETGLGGDDIRVMDVITNGINRLRFDFFGPRDNSKRFALLHLAVPTVIYHTSHYLISNATYDWIYVMARRYVVSHFNFILFTIAFTTVVGFFFFKQTHLQMDS